MYFFAFTASFWKVSSFIFWSFTVQILCKNSWTFNTSSICLCCLWGRLIFQRGAYFIIGCSRTFKVQSSWIIVWSYTRSFLWFKRCHTTYSGLELLHPAPNQLETCRVKLYISISIWWLFTKTASYVCFILIRSSWCHISIDLSLLWLEIFSTNNAHKLWVACPLVFENDRFCIDEIWI